MGLFSRARDEIRTRDPHVGNVMLYQLSYSRKMKFSWEKLPPYI